MQTTQLEAFVAVAEELHFGRAAQRLFLTQPALSRTIRQLEDSLDTRLFDRSTRSVSLTAAGRALLEPARDALSAMRVARDAVAANESGAVGRVRVGFAGPSTHRVVADLVRTVQSDRPGIQLVLRSQQYALPALRRVQDGESDLALGRWDYFPRGLESRVVRQDRLMLAIPADHRLAGARSMSFDDLEAERFVTLEPHEGAVLIDRLRRLAHHSGWAPEIGQVAPDTETALSLVSARMGCLLTLQSVAETSSRSHVAFARVAGAQKVDDVHLRAAWRSGNASPALGVVLDCLRHLS